MCRILYKRHTERGSHAAQLTVYKRRHFVSAEQGPGRTLVFLRKCFPALNWNTLAHAHIQYTHAYSTYMPECTEIKAHRRFNTDQRTCTINRQKTNKQNNNNRKRLLTHWSAANEASPRCLVSLLLPDGTATDWRGRGSEGKQKTLMI